MPIDVEFTLRTGEPEDEQTEYALPFQKFSKFTGRTLKSSRLTSRGFSRYSSTGRLLSPPFESIEDASVEFLVDGTTDVPDLCAVFMLRLFNKTTFNCDSGEVRLIKNGAVTPGLVYTPGGESEISGVRAVGRKHGVRLDAAANLFFDTYPCAEPVEPRQKASVRLGVLRLSSCGLDVPTVFEVEDITESGEFGVTGRGTLPAIGEVRRDNGPGGFVPVAPGDSSCNCPIGSGTKPQYPCPQGSRVCGDPAQTCCPAATPYMLNGRCYADQGEACRSEGNVCPYVCNG